MRTLQTAGVALLAGLGIATYSSTGTASTIYADFNAGAACSSGLNCSGNGPIAKATIADLSGGGVSIDIPITQPATSTQNGFAFVESGNPPIVTFQAAPTTAAGASLSGTSTSMDALGNWILDPPNKNPNGYGTGTPGFFSHSVGYGKSNTPFTFDIMFTLAGVTTGDFSANSDGYIMAVDMCSNASVSGKTLSCGGTGFVGGTLSIPTNQGGETPLPGTLILMGTVLAGGAGFGAWRRRGANRHALAA